MTADAIAFQASLADLRRRLALLRADCDRGHVRQADLYDIYDDTMAVLLDIAKGLRNDEQQTLQ